MRYFVLLGLFVSILAHGAPTEYEVEAGTVIVGHNQPVIIVGATTITTHKCTFDKTTKAHWPKSKTRIRQFKRHHKIVGAVYQHQIIQNGIDPLDGGELPCTFDGAFIEVDHFVATKRWEMAGITSKKVIDRKDNLFFVKKRLNKSKKHWIVYKWQAKKGFPQAIIDKAKEMHDNIVCDGVEIQQTIDPAWSFTEERKAILGTSECPPNTQERMQ